MIVQLFSVYDAAAERYIEPFPAPTLTVALRGFEEACTTKGHQFVKFPIDYSLWHIGEFDAVTGVLEPMQARKIAMATQYRQNLDFDGPLSAEDSVSEKEA